MYVPITFVGLPLDFRKETNVRLDGRRVWVGWWLLRSTLEKHQQFAVGRVFCFIRSTSDLSFSSGMHIGTTLLFCVRRRKQIERWESWGKDCSQIKMLLKDKEMGR